MTRSAFALQLVSSALLTSCYRLPTESRLAANFVSHRKAFDGLVTMYQEDWRFRRIAEGQVPPKGMPEERYQKYIEVFRQLEIDGGITRDLSPTTPGIYIIAGAMVPMGGRSRSVGYFYSAAAPASLLNSLQISQFPFERSSGHRTVYRKLEDGWYLFYDNSS
jgi:hypothetical protein